MLSLQDGKIEKLNEQVKALLEEKESLEEKVSIYNPPLLCSGIRQLSNTLFAGKKLHKTNANKREGDHAIGEGSGGWK